MDQVPVTVSQVKAAIEKAAIKEVLIRVSTCCQYPVGFLFREGRVLLDCGCDCNRLAPREVPWTDVCALINTQRVPALRDHYMKLCGMEVPE